MESVHVHKREKEGSVNCERHCLWKRYTPSLWILAKPLEEKVEFSLTKRQWLYLLKKGKKKKKVGKPADVEP